MAEIAIIKLSQLQQEKRMDAGFHIALDQVRDRVEELKAILTAEEARSKLEGIPLKDKAPLLVLTRGTAALRSADMDRIEREYPHLSLAIMEKNLQHAIERVRSRIADDQDALAALLALQGPAATAMLERRFEAGHIYPLQDPTRFDDDYGTGFDHVAIAHDATPGDCHIHDAWPVNAAGEVHPGYDASPVPIRLDDIRVEEGRALASSLPSPRPFGSW